MSSPTSWTRTRIDRVAKVNARIGWKALTASEYQPDGYAFLATPNIKSNRIDFENVNYIDKFRYDESPELKLQVNDVLLAKDGSTLGITNIVRELPRPSTVNGSIAVLRPFNIEPRFLYYALASGEIQGIIASVKGGMGVPHLFQWDIKRLPVAIPSLDEQRRIADFLDAETADIDQLQSARQRQSSLLTELALSLVSACLPKPGQATFVRLGYLAAIQSGLTVDGNRASSADAVTLPYLRVANVQDGHLDLTSVAEMTVPRVAARSAVLRAGDVLMTEGGDLDKLGRGTVWFDEIKPCLHQNHVFAIRPNQDRLTSEFLALLTRSPYARSYFESTGTKTTNLASTSSSKIRDFKVPLLTIADQIQIFHKVDAQLREVDRLRDSFLRQNSLLNERRQTLVTAAVTGRIDVSTARGKTASDGDVS